MSFRTVFASVLPATVLAIVAGSASAHEFIVLADPPRAAQGAPFGVEVISTHTLIAPEELEAPEVSRVQILHQGSRTPVALEPDAKRLVYQGRATAPSSGGFLLVGQRLPLLFSTTPEGGKPGGRVQNPTAVSVGRTEKFSKTLVNLSPTDTAWQTVAGDRLEILPTANPATIRPGQELPVRVVFEGQPLGGTTVLATHQGFSGEPETYAYRTLANADGTAKVKITAPGTWVIRVENRQVLRGNPDLDTDTARAVLVFTAD